MITRKEIDVNYDFTLDTPKFWQDFWGNDNNLGKSKHDPDSESKTMQLYHKLLYIKQLPNGENLNLEIGNKFNYLKWKNFRFSSDSLVTSFRFKRNEKFINIVAKNFPDYKKFIVNYIHKSYTLGGEIIFPKRKNGINQTRGCNYLIRDRFDLTLECIRRFYNGEQSPLYKTLLEDKEFFDLFINFKNFVNFFYLQDLVNDNYLAIKFWYGKGSFNENPIPQSNILLTN